jgi:hypothetical protein
MAGQKRDYAAEYQSRVARGLAKGLSRSQARGHPRATEQHLSSRRAASRSLEAGVAALRKTKSLSAAARQAKIAPERLRRYLMDLDFVAKQRGRWVVGTDTRLRPVLIYANGQKRKIVVQGYEPAALIGSHWNAVGKFRDENDPAYLAPFIGVEVRDANGRPYIFETRPNVLYRLSNEGGDSFEQVYRIIV